MLGFDAVEDICERSRTTLVLHPAVRRAVRAHDESFHVGLRCFLKGETDGLYGLPLPNGGYVKLRFEKRSSLGGYNILRVSPVAVEGLEQIKRAMDD